MNAHKIVYPTFIALYEDDYLVYVPDLEIYTEGKSIDDAIEMARDAIGLKGIDYEDDKKDLPQPSTYDKAIKIAKANSEIFDYSKGLLTLVDVDLAEYRRKRDNRAVKKNCTIPYWLSVEAENAGVNYSKLLQEAIINTLGINKNV